MSNQKKIEPEAVLEAIKSLQEKGWDINPYTVADEAKIPRSTLYRSQELMDLVSQARGENTATVQAGAAAAATAAAEEGTKRVAELEARISELENQVVVFENQVVVLENQVTELRAANESLAVGEQEAWQAGYQAAVYELKKQAAEALVVEAPADDTGGGADTAGWQPEQAGWEAPAEPTAMADMDNESSFEPPVDYESYIAEKTGEQDKSFDSEARGVPFSQSESDAPVLPHEAVDEIAAEEFFQPSEPSLQSDYTAQNEADSQESASAYQNYNEESADFGAPSGWGAPQINPESYAPAGESSNYGDELQPIDPPIFSGSLYDDVVAASEQQAAEPEPAGQDDDSDLTDEQLDYKIKTTTLTEDDLRELMKHRFGKLTEDAPPEKTEDEGAKKVAGTKFVGSHRAQQDPPQQGFVVRSVPPDIRKACLVLGLRPEEITLEEVHKAWKREMAREHPDTGGDTEIAVYLNTAKDTLFRWLEAQAPKLGKKFGSSTMQFKKPAEKDSKAPETPEDK